MILKWILVYLLEFTTFETLNNISLICVYVC